MKLEEIRVRPVERSEETYYQGLMQGHHYLGALPKIGETLWYVATYHGQWAALLSFSAAAWKCGVRDRWIGWYCRHRYDRLKLLANNNRFLILPTGIARISAPRPSRSAKDGSLATEEGRIRGLPPPGYDQDATEEAVCQGQARTGLPLLRTL